MNTPSRRRWVLPVYVLLLVIWTLAVVVSFAWFGGPTGPATWLQIGVIYLALVVLLRGEWMARRGGP